MTAGDGSVEHSEARALKSDDTVFLVIRNECSEPVTLTVEHEIDIVLTLPIRPLRNIVQVRESRLMWVSVAFAFRTTAQAQHLGVIIMLLSVIGYVECVAVPSKQCLQLCALEHVMRACARAFAACRASSGLRSVYFCSALESGFGRMCALAGRQVRLTSCLWSLSARTPAWPARMKGRTRRTWRRKLQSSHAAVLQPRCFSGQSGV